MPGILPFLVARAVMDEEHGSFRIGERMYHGGRVDDITSSEVFCPSFITRIDTIKSIGSCVI